jgi:hypothetical protein
MQSNIQSQNYAVFSKLKKVLDLAIFIDPDGLCGWFAWQTRHNHDLYVC